MYSPKCQGLLDGSLNHRGNDMLIQIGNGIMVNTDHIVTIENVESPVDFKTEVRITLIGRMAEVVVTGDKAKEVWEMFQKCGHDF